MDKTTTYLTADVVVFDGPTVLLIQRKNQPFQDCWALPGGFFDAEDRHVKEAAIRELREETSLRADDLELVGVYSARMRDPRENTAERERIVSVAYWCEFDRQVAKVQAGDDAAGIGWFDYLKLPPTAFDHRQIIKDAVQCREKQSR